MPDRKVLVSNQLLQVESSNEADAELLAHFKSNVNGTPGQTRYKLTRIENKLAHMKNLYFVLLKRKGKVMGSVGFHRRETAFDDTFHKSWYIRYFYIHAPFRSKQQLNKKFRQSDLGSNIIRDAAMPYMRDPALLMDEGYNPNEKALIYAYIETMNFRSMNFSIQMGAETIRKFLTLFFTRIKLKNSLNIQRIEKKEIDNFKTKLKDFYKNYSFFTTENMFFDGNYFVYKEKGEILVGMQVHPESWKIVEIPGRTNRVMLKILPYLPGIRNIFNPKDFRFLAIEGIYFKKGKEHLLEAFMESACKHFNTHFALIWVDSDSEMHSILKKHVNFGMIGRSFDKVDANIRVRFNNYTEEEKKLFYESPAYISAYDSV